VSGNLITLAGGLVTIDATNARIVGNRGDNQTVATIERGALIFATLRTTDVAANAPLPAALIAVTRNADVTLFGPVQNVDRTNNTLTVLGRTIRITPQTSFGGFFPGRETAPSLADVQTNMLVGVQANANGASLVAQSVTLIAPVVPTRPSAVSGTVRSIGTDSWVVDSNGRAITLVVNANTKIIGSPKVGDRVEVLYTVDSSNANVAYSIVKHADLPKIVQFRGVVKSIGANAWVITREGSDVTVRVNERTRLVPGTEAGHTVEVMATQEADGTLTAIAILRLR
jgi:hypothetical protein